MATDPLPPLPPVPPSSLPRPSLVPLSAPPVSPSASSGSFPGVDVGHEAGEKGRKECSEQNERKGSVHALARRCERLCMAGRGLQETIRICP